MSDIVERLKSNEPLPICLFDSKSPNYWTTPDDKPCPFCGQENTTEGPDKCRGADTRLFAEAADEIERLREALFQIAHQRYGAPLNAIDNYNELQAIARAALATGGDDE